MLMRRCMAWVLLLLLLVCSAASAESKVVTALAAEVNPDHLVSVAVDAKIISCDGSQATVTVLVPERYLPEEIRALKIGDAIYTQGREVEVRSITEKDGYLVLNEGTDDAVWLFESVDMNYWIMDMNDNTWTEFATVTVPVSDHLIFLDEIDPSTGEGLLNPSVHNKAGFLKTMGSAGDPGFDLRNVKAVFDEDGALAVIRRFYVPWQ